MARALQLAERGRYSTSPNPRVGCVIARMPDAHISEPPDQEYTQLIISEGWHQQAGEPHAEVHALAQAREIAQQTNQSIKVLLKNATAYVTLEPCSHYGRTPPCALALIEAGIGRVVMAMQDPNPQVAGRGMRMLQEAGIEVESGLMEAEARTLNRGFLSSMERHRPWVRLKLASSLDGRTAMQNGDSVWITGDAARADTQRLRAEADAIITGSGTVLTDDPLLSCRYDVPEPYAPRTKQPLRVIMDSQLRTPLDARIITTEGDVLVVYAGLAELPEQKLSPNQPLRMEALQAAGVECVSLVSNTDDSGLDLKALLAELHQRNIQQVHVECGAVLAGAWLRSGLVDEVVLYQAPCLMGDGAKPLAEWNLQNMVDIPRYTLDDVRRVGDDIRLTLSV